MRFAIAASIAALSTIALGQGQLSNIPTCAQSCFGTGNLGSCSIIDVGCICGSSAITQVGCCVLATCDAADTNTTITFAQTLCKGAGVDVNINPDCGAANSSASASASSSASVAASSSASRSASPSGSAAATAAASTAAAAFQTAGASLGLGVAIIGMLAAL